MDILGGIAVFLLILAGTGLAMRRAGSPARYPGAARSRAHPTGTRPGARHRRSWLVTAAKAAGADLTSDHLGRASAELAGKATGATARAVGRLARRGGHRLAGLAARRWQARGDAVSQPLFLTRLSKPADSADGAPGQPGQPTQPPPDAGPAPATGGQQPTATPPARRRARKETTAMRYRHSVSLERPSTDAEFLESCIQLADVLKALAEEVADWADSLSGLNLPQSVLTPLHQVSEGIEEAATGASQSAQAFEDEFEDARDVASRGMHFTGEDAA